MRVHGRNAKHDRRLTVIDLLQCNDRVRRQTLLRVLVEQESLGRHRALLRWRRHGGLVVMGGIHGCSGGGLAAKRGAKMSRRRDYCWSRGGGVAKGEFNLKRRSGPGVVRQINRWYDSLVVRGGDGRAR